MNTPHPYSTNHPGRQTPRVEKISQNPKQNTISRHASRARSSRWYTVQIIERESPSPAGRRRCSPTRIVRGRSRQKKKKRVKGGESLFENRVTDATNAMLCCETDSAVRQSRSSSPRQTDRTEQNRTEPVPSHHRSLYTLGFHPSRNSLSCAAFRSAWRSSISIRSRARRILLWR